MKSGQYSDGSPNYKVTIARFMFASSRWPLYSPHKTMFHLTNQTIKKKKKTPIVLQCSIVYYAVPVSLKSFPSVLSPTPDSCVTEPSDEISHRPPQDVTAQFVLITNSTCEDISPRYMVSLTLPVKRQAV